MNITLNFKSSESDSYKFLLPKIVLSVPYADIVLSTLFIPFSAVLILFPGHKDDNTCKNNVPFTGKVFIALGYSLLYFMQFGFFRSLLRALLLKSADRLNTWIRMKLIVLGIYSITTIILLYFMHSRCTLPHTVVTVVYAVYSIFSLTIVYLHKGKLVSFISRCNESESSSQTTIMTSVGS